MQEPEQYEVESIRETLLNLNNQGTQALAAGHFKIALECYAQAAADLRPDEDHLAAVIYENMGLALMRLGEWRAAQRAFLRALDGDYSQRELSLRLLILALFNDAKPQWGRQMLAEYERRFGPHPDGVRMGE
jgi:tetratricopeptide (TPR) repeat protein